MGLSLSIASFVVAAGAVAAWMAGLLGARADWIAVALLVFGAALAAGAYVLDGRRARRQLAVVLLGLNAFGLLLILATIL